MMTAVVAVSDSGIVEVLSCVDTAAAAAGIDAKVGQRSRRPFGRCMRVGCNRGKGE